MAMVRKQSARLKLSTMAPLFDRNDTVRPVVKEAENILQEVKGRALYMIPFRLMRHLPQHDSLLRPVDPVRVSFLSAGMSTTGFRKHEPVCANDPIPEIGVPMHVISGNHRHASTRDSGQVLVPTNSVSSKHVRRMMRLLRKEDQILVDKGILKSQFSDRDEAFRCLQILATTLQSIEPAPKALTCLQQVQLIRTAVRNDPLLNFEHAHGKQYGGADGLRDRIFPTHAGSDNSDTHFLVNEQMSTRHKNKLLAGAKVLIYTKCPFSLPELGERNALLDVLVYWESKGFIPQFLETNLSYAGPISKHSPRAISEIMEDVRAKIGKGDFKAATFNTDAFKRYGKGKRAKNVHLDIDHSSDSSSYTPKRKRKLASTSADASRQTKKQKNAKSSTSVRSRPPRNKPRPVRRAGSVYSSADESESTGIARRDVQSRRSKDHKTKKQSAPSPTPDDHRKDAHIVKKATEDGNLQSKRSSDSRSVSLSYQEHPQAAPKSKSIEILHSTSISKAPRDRNQIQVIEKRFQEFRLEKEQELIAVRKQLEDEFRSRKEREIAAVKEKLIIEQKVQTEQSLKKTIEENKILSRKLEKLVEEKNEELGQFKEKLSSEIRLELQAKFELSRKKTIDDNENLRKKLEDLEKSADEKYRQEAVRVQQLLKVNEEMKRKLEAAEVRRTSRPRIPTVVVLEGYSNESLQLLKQRILSIESAR